MNSKIPVLKRNKYTGKSIANTETSLNYIPSNIKKCKPLDTILESPELKKPGLKTGEQFQVYVCPIKTNEGKKNVQKKLKELDKKGMENKIKDQIQVKKLEKVCFLLQQSDKALKSKGNYDYKSKFSDIYFESKKNPDDKSDSRVDTASSFDIEEPERPVPKPGRESSKLKLKKSKLKTDQQFEKYLCPIKTDKGENKIQKKFKELDKKEMKHVKENKRKSKETDGNKTKFSEECQIEFKYSDSKTKPTRIPVPVTSPSPRSSFRFRVGPGLKESANKNDFLHFAMIVPSDGKSDSQGLISDSASLLDIAEPVRPVPKPETPQSRSALRSQVCSEPTTPSSIQSSKSMSLSTRAHEMDSDFGSMDTETNYSNTSECRSGFLTPTDFIDKDLAGNMWETNLLHIDNSEWNGIEEEIVNVTENGYSVKKVRNICKFIHEDIEDNVTARIELGTPNKNVIEAQENLQQLTDSAHAVHINQTYAEYDNNEIIYGNNHYSLKTTSVKEEANISAMQLILRPDAPEFIPVRSDKSDFSEHYSFTSYISDENECFPGVFNTNNIRKQTSNQESLVPLVGKLKPDIDFDAVESPTSNNEKYKSRTVRGNIYRGDAMINFSEFGVESNFLTQPINNMYKIKRSKIISPLERGRVNPLGFIELSFQNDLIVALTMDLSILLLNTVDKVFLALSANELHAGIHFRYGEIYQNRDITEFNCIDTFNEISKCARILDHGIIFQDELSPTTYFLSQAGVATCPRLSNNIAPDFLSQIFYSGRRSVEDCIELLAQSRFLIKRDGSTVWYIKNIKIKQTPDGQLVVHKCNAAYTLIITPRSITGDNQYTVSSRLTTPKIHVTCSSTIQDQNNTFHMYAKHAGKKLYYNEEKFVTRYNTQTAGIDDSHQIYLDAT